MPYALDIQIADTQATVTFELRKNEIHILRIDTPNGAISRGGSVQYPGLHELIHKSEAAWKPVP